MLRISRNNTIDFKKFVNNSLLFWGINFDVN